MLIRKLTSLIALGMLVLAMGNASASDKATYLADKLRSSDATLESISNRLASSEPGKWSQGDQEEFLKAQLQYAYWAISSYIAAKRQHPTSWEDLRTAGLITSTPRNPYNSWQDVKLTYDSTSFSPGDLFVQLCPPDWYSYKNKKTGETIPITFAIGVFGPTEEFKGIGGPVIFRDKYNILSWAQVPIGTAFLTAMRRTSAEDADRIQAEAVARALPVPSDPMS